MRKLEKVILLSIHKVWLDMMESGEKDQEFREKIGVDWEPGMRVVLVSTKSGGGSGKLEAEFTMGSITTPTTYALANALVKEERAGSHQAAMRMLKKMGYNQQKNVIEIKEFFKWPKPKELRKIYSWNKLFKDFEDSARYDMSVDGVIRTKAESVQYVKDRIDYYKEAFLNSDQSCNVYDPCRGSVVPQSWAYGGVVVDE